MSRGKISEREPARSEAKNWLAEMSDATDFKQRMYLCAGLVGSVNGLASAAGISQSGIRNYFAGSDPNREILSRLARAAGVRFEWLGEGTGPMRDIPPILIHSVLQSYGSFCLEHSLTDSKKSKARFVVEYNNGEISHAQNVSRLLPRIALLELKNWTSDAGIRATTGAYTDVPQLNTKDSRDPKPVIREQILFSTDWLMAELKVKPEQVRQWRVDGEAMAPTICPGDIVLVHAISTNFPGDGIYMIKLDGVTLPKRIQWLGTKRILLKSDNGAYRDLELNLDDQEPTSPRLSILGRVIWYGRRL